ncbi:AbrB/MazE/SpoVT family DNA-binding domain-containing protein [Candidatus Micrarchaeota archaeon]|nr:AbrB/MazE/SpoVT family DNA-binding domain-containing protein [Candidatus Micrarchaeota archaeon]
MKFGGTGVVTRQGQVTLPKNARDEGEFEVGSVIEFFYSEDIVLIKKKKEPIEVFKEISKKATERFKKHGITEKVIQKEIENYRRGKK